MASVTARILFTCLVVGAAAAASGEAPRDSSDARATAPASPVLLAAAGEPAISGASRRDKPIVLASNLAPAGMTATGYLHRREPAPSSGDFEVKEWMLIAMGFFLICAMSHRRSQSMAD